MTDDLPPDWHDRDGIGSYEDAIAELRRRHVAGEPVRIVLAGAPCPWARHMGGRSTRPFTPVKQRNNAAAWRIAAQQAMAGRAPFAGPVAVFMVAAFAIPKGFSKVKRGAAIRGEVLPAKRPDIDNLFKAFADSANAIVFQDDAQICEIRMQKVYAEIPQCEVIVRPIE